MVQGQNNKRSGRSKNFHFRYLELCRSRNFPSLTEVKSKNNDSQNLDFFGDKFKIDDWLLINESLSNDQVLVNICIRLRKNFGYVVESVDSEKKARMYKNRPVIFTKYVFMGLVEAISNCISRTRNLTTLTLEGLPLTDKYVHYIANALSMNESIQSISFARSSIGDKGCEILCDVIKCLPNIEKVNMSNCQLSIEGASHIADMIKYQKIYRYSEGWKQSLRYRDVNPDSLQGLRVILISQNPEIGDEGVQIITEVLKEDVWIKIVDVEDCGITTIGARYIYDCLQFNHSIAEFSIRGNPEINETALRSIYSQLGKSEVQENDHIQPSNKINTITKLRERLHLLEEQLAREKSLRKQVDILNEQLHDQIRAIEQKHAEEEKAKIPEGYTLVRQESWDNLVTERNNLSHTLIAIRSHYKRYRLKKAKSETIPKFLKHRNHKYSKSEHKMIESPYKTEQQTQRVYVETGIGDTKDNKSCQEECESITEKIESKKSSARHYPSRENFTAMEELKVIVKKKTDQFHGQGDFEQIKNDARALFIGSS